MSVRVMEVKADLTRLPQRIRETTKRLDSRRRLDMMRATTIEVISPIARIDLLSQSGEVSRPDGMVAIEPPIGNKPHVEIRVVKKGFLQRHAPQLRDPSPEMV